MASTQNLRSAGKPFSPRAVSYLLKNAGKMKASSIANVLGRTEKSIRRKAEKLGVSLAVN